MTKKPGKDDAQPDITAQEDGPSEIADEALDDAQGGFRNFLTIDARTTEMSTLFAGAQDFNTADSDFATLGDSFNTADTSFNTSFNKLKR